MNSNIYIAQLPKDMQREILEKVRVCLEKEGLSSEKIEESLENVKCDRLWVVEDIIDIKKYIGGNKL